MVVPSIELGTRPTVVVVGAATRDISATDQRGWKLGGGVTFSALAAANLGVRVQALIGVDSEAATAPELDLLHRAGIELLLVPLEHGPVFDNQKTATGRVQYALGASDQIPVSALPDSWRASKAALLAPVAGELGDDWSSVFASDTFVTLAVQGLVRDMRPGQEVRRLPLARGPLIERADALALSREDVAAGAPALRDLTHAGQRLVITHGKYGALDMTRTETGIAARFTPPLPRRKAVDATGAGDTFVAAWLATRLLVGDGWRPLTVASAMSSLAVERASLEDWPTLRDVCEVLVTLRDRRLP